MHRIVGFQIVEYIADWKDFARQARMVRNMQPQHARAANNYGSWGVGRFYFNVKPETGRLFRLYYHRALKDAFDQSGVWVLLAE